MLFVRSFICLVVAAVGAFSNNFFWIVRLTECDGDSLSAFICYVVCFCGVASNVYF